MLDLHACSPRRALARRALLLLGTSFVACAVLPTAAIAQNECGPPPPGGGTVTCPPSGNPYPGGVNYDPVVQDLTVVLQQGVVVTGGVELGTIVGAVDLSLQAGSGTQISSGAQGREGVDIQATTGAVTIDAAAVSTTGLRAEGIQATAGSGAITITSGTVSTLGNGSTGILAETASGAIVINSGSVTTAGNTFLGQPGVIAAGAHGTEARSGSGPVTIGSTSVATGGSEAIGILAETDSGAIDITSGSVITQDGEGIDAESIDGDINIESGSVTTVGGLFSHGIIAQTDTGNIVIDSGTVSVDHGVGLFAITQSGNITITSDSVTVTGSGAGINASGEYYTGGDISVTSGTVVTHGFFTTGIDADSRGAVSVVSGSVTTTGERAIGIEVASWNGGVTIVSGTVATSGRDSRGIKVNAYNDAEVDITSGTVTTLGDNGDGIVAVADQDITITSTSVSTQGHRANGIYAYTFADGDIVVTSGAITTAGDTQNVPYGGSHGMELHANGGSVTVTSTTVATQGAGSRGIFATSNAGAINITSGTVTTAGAGAIGISAATGPGSTTPAVSSAGAVLLAAEGPGNAAPVAVAPDISITSASVTTTGADAIGISASAQAGDIHIESGSVNTSGANATGIRAQSQSGGVTVDSGAVNATGAGADAILVSSGTTSNLIIRGLVRSTNGFAIQANGGAATVTTVAGGTIRGRIDLTGGNDQVNNAGTFDAIGTSDFGAGADVFNNNGTTRSTGGAAVFAGLETFNNSGLIDFGDGNANDRLTLGNFNGLAGSRLTVDVDFTAGVADVLVTGVATGSTTITVNGIGAQFGFTNGILVVDAAAGTAATAFSLAGGNSSNGYFTTGLIFEPSTFNFLLVNAPGQAVFETGAVGGMTLDLWHLGADAVETQLETARAPSRGGSSANNLTSGGRLGGWIQALAGDADREATQSFTSGGVTTSFDVSYEQNFEGLQAGFDYQSGPVIFGLTFGLAQSDSQFETSPSTVEMESKNFGAYAAFASGNFYLNMLAKVDWIDLETNPGAGLAAEFDAMSYGIRGVAGFRFDFGRFFAEPSVSLSWARSDIDDYASGGAIISFDNATSLRGTAGLRLGGAFATQSGGVISPYAGLRVIGEFSDDNASDFFLGTILNLTDDRSGTHAEASAGLTYRTDSVEAFLRGELDLGSEVEGRTARAGIRVRF